MSRLDQFESVFKSAARESYEYERVDASRILLVSDLGADATKDLLAQIRAFLAVLEGATWEHLCGERRLASCP